MKGAGRITILSLLAAFAAILGLPMSVHATDITVRLGQGGFRDSRAPDGTLGGGQLCLDLKIPDWPIVLSIGQESYTKGPDATLACEISSLTICSAFFMKPISSKWPANLYLGGGLGRLEIPQGDQALVVQAITRIDAKLVWKIYGYIEGKYIFSKKDLIDFNEVALLLGIAFKFQL